MVNMSCLFFKFNKSIEPSYEQIDLPHPSSQPVDFILDALLGSSGSLSSLLRPSDRSDLMTVIQWANTNRAPMLSLDLPSGLLDVSGCKSFLPCVRVRSTRFERCCECVCTYVYMHATHYFSCEQEIHSVHATCIAPHRVSAVIEPKFLLSLGLPLSHLLYAPQTLTPELFLADIGLPCGLLSRVLTAQKSHSSHSVGDRGAVPYLSPFGDKFVVGLRRGSL